MREVQGQEEVLQALEPQRLDTVYSYLGAELDGGPAGCGRTRATRARWQAALICPADGDARESAHAKLYGRRAD
jgi:hypothetical protein